MITLITTILWCIVYCGIFIHYLILSCKYRNLLIESSNKINEIIELKDDIHRLNDIIHKQNIYITELELKISRLEA